ncbi:MAG TPA: urea ABC transporter permease subunit UrtB [Burkholderiales bacterium]|nr:urea ABC transporter permease subunit UrtB [Burkholderiales bacterium]
MPQPSWALPPELVSAIATGDSDAKIEAIAKLAATGEEAARSFLQALLDGEVQVANGDLVLLVGGDAAMDAASGRPVTPLPQAREDVVINNRVRGKIGEALAALGLTSPDAHVRLEAARTLQSGADPAMLPLLTRASEKEADSEVKALLLLACASLQLAAEDSQERLAAVRALGQSTHPHVRTLLASRLEKQGESYVEPDANVRAEVSRSLEAIDSRLAMGQRVAQLFSGLSLGSILLLAALGLAITYGLMGVINMAHGEFIMIGAYATYLVQNFFRDYLPDAFNAYLLFAIPASFIAAALIGILLERLVIRFLYGRPLETLLATWGASLFLMQTVRTFFGAQNVQVENPIWMSGGFELMPEVILPYNRIVIIVFTAFVIAGIWLLLTRTRLGLFVRAVTQNRSMASCVGVRTGRVDMLAFGLGAGMAGLAGCALSQIGNVGPDLGQSYIVDSFMVVVLGGVGHLAGTVYAALGLGIINKFLEGWTGAVIAKIIVLVFIIIFIQKRPQGLFALKGRAQEA